MNLTLRDLEQRIQEIKTKHHDLPMIMDVPVVFVGQGEVGSLESLDVWFEDLSFQVMIRHKPILRTQAA